MTVLRETEHPVDPLFTQRWSPRAFTGEALPRELLLRFLEAARWAPSGFNSQPWRFVYGLRGTPAWDGLFGTLSPYNQGWAAQASALVLVLSKTHWVPPGKTELQPLATHAFDAGAAWASLAFQVTLAGWHAHGIGGFDHDALRTVVGATPEHALHAVIAIGRLGDKDQLPEALRAREAPNQREPLASLVSEGRLASPA